MKGTTLVYQLEHFPGLFRDPAGNIHDLRPSSKSIIRPSLKTFNEMDTSRLQSLLLKAYRAQLDQLRAPTHQPYDGVFERDVLVPKLEAGISALEKLVAP